MTHVEELPNSTAIDSILEDFSSLLYKRTPSSDLEIDPTLLAPERRQLTDLLAKYSECFATSSRVRQTTIAEHRIVTDEDVLPVH